jgi:hypothetical protein
LLATGGDSRFRVVYRVRDELLEVATVFRASRDDFANFRFISLRHKEPEGLLSLDLELVTYSWSDRRCSGSVVR